VKALYRDNMFILQTPYGEISSSLGVNNDQETWVHWGFSFDEANGKASLFRFGVEVGSVERSGDIGVVSPGQSGEVTDDYASLIPGYEYDLCRCPAETPCYNLKNFNCEAFSTGGSTCADTSVNCETARDERSRKVYMMNVVPPLQARSRSHNCGDPHGMYLLPVHVVADSTDTKHTCTNPTKSCSDCTLAAGDHCYATDSAFVLDESNCNSKSEYVVVGTEPFHGNIADVRLYNKPLSCHDPSVQNFWEPPLPVSSLLAWFRFSTANSHADALKSEIVSDGTILPASEGDVKMVAYTHQHQAEFLLYEDGNHGLGTTKNTMVPLGSSLVCSFRNLIFFQNPFSSVSATAPDSSFTDAQCQAQQNNAALSYSWESDIQSSVQTQCVYLNGFLWKKDGSALANSVTHTFEQRESVFDLGFNSWMSSQTTYIEQMLPPGSCPSSCTSSSSDCSGLLSGQTFTISVQGNQIVAQRTDSSSGWTNSIGVTCKVPGARQSFCVKAGNSGGDMGYQCATALFFDGTPLDLRPTLTRHGIEFSFTDTNILESGFEVIRADSVFTLADGVIVTKIPYGLPACGRQFQSISLTDQQASNHPGMLFVYGIKAENSDTDYESNIKSAVYRVPWAAELEIEVNTPNDVGVSNVLVEICHKADPDDASAISTTAEEDLCWLGLTNKFGLFSLEVSVSREDWTEEIRHFQMRAVPRPLDAECDESFTLKNQLIEAKTRASVTFDALCAVDGAECSKFEPASMLVSVYHMGPLTRSFTDQTSLTVWGEVLFDPIHVGGTKCGIGGAEVTVIKSGETTTLTADEWGQFNFSATRGQVVTVSVAFGEHSFASTKQVVAVGASDEHIVFHDTTMQELSLDVVDEMKSQHIMTQDLIFRLTSPSCVSPGFILDIPDRLVSRQLPALEYDVVIADGPAIDFSALIAATPNTFCSKAPQLQVVDFFNSMGNMERSVDIRHAPGSEQWVFRTGLCIYSTDFDNLPTDNTDTCDEPDNTYVYANQGQQIDLSLKLFELFPTTGDNGVRTGVGGSVTVSEEVNGDSSECNPRNGLAASCVQQVTVDEDCGIFGCEATVSLIAGAPSLLSAANNFLRLMEITTVRNMYNFDCPEDGCTPALAFDQLDTVTISRWVPVLGEFALSDVAKTETVSTGQSMVFNVLHDPPGGLSSVSWDEGSTMGFTISMQGHAARHTKDMFFHSLSGGVEFTTKAMVAPMGLGIETPVFSGGVTVEHSRANTWNHPESDNVYAHDKGWDIGFRLGKAISTSGAAGTAGRASDMILGGGLELLFTEVIKVFRNTSRDSLCINSDKETVWEPAKLTTFLYSLEEIYDQMDRARVQAAALFEKANSDDNNGLELNKTLLAQQAQYVEDKYSDWVNIVDTYERSHNHAKLVQEAEQNKAAMHEVLNFMSTSESTVLDLSTVKRIGSKLGKTDDTDEAEVRAELYQRMNNMKNQYDQLNSMCQDEGQAPSPETMHSDSGGAEVTALAKECNLLQNHPGRILSNVFSKQQAFSGEGVPGTPLISGMQGELDALNGNVDSDRPSYISFAGGGGALTISHTVSNAAHFTLGLSAADTYLSDHTYTVGFKAKVTALVGATSVTRNQDETDSQGEGGSRGSAKGYATKVSWTLGDPNPKDKFIVAVHDNLMYGTPVFRTIGGQSRCPAEPTTLPRESGAQILSIEPLCEGDTTSHTECLQVMDGEFASFKVTLSVNYQDCAQTGDDGRCIKQASDEPYNFLLRMTDEYDCSGDSCESTEESDTTILHAAPGSDDYPTCNGKEGKNGGLVVLVDGVVMGKEFIRFPRLPLGQSEFLLQIGRGATCYNYKDISLSLTSECEYFMYNSMCIMEQPDLDDPDHQPFFAPGAEGTSAESRDWCSERISNRYLFNMAWETPAQLESRLEAEEDAKQAAQDAEYEETKTNYQTTFSDANAGLGLMAETKSASFFGENFGVVGALLGVVVIQLAQMGATFYLASQKESEGAMSQSGGETMPINREFL